jgi:hypothetical protein
MIRVNFNAALCKEKELPEVIYNLTVLSILWTLCYSKPVNNDVMIAKQINWVKFGLKLRNSSFRERHTRIWHNTCVRCR